MVFCIPKVIAIARVLMMKRTGLAYTALFAYLKELCPNMSPVRIHCDFERGLMNAIRLAFPAPCSIYGCLWHYAVVSVTVNVIFFSLCLSGFTLKFYFVGLQFSSTILWPGTTCEGE